MILLPYADILEASISMSKYLRTLIALIVLLIVGGICLFIFYPQPEPSEQEQTLSEDEQVSDTSAEVSGSVEIVPEASPTENTNPFEDTYKNPFE